MKGDSQQETRNDPGTIGRKNKDGNFQVPNDTRERLIVMTQLEGVSVYKAHKKLGINYQTAKYIVKNYRRTRQVVRINKIVKSQTDVNKDDNLDNPSQ